jgi:hypothetical protein
MDQKEARRLAQALTCAGFRAVADSRGGWSGGPASQVWGVKPFPDDGLTGIYETRDQMPRKWLKVVTAVEAVDRAVAAELKHSRLHQGPGRGACDRCGDLSDVTERASERLRELYEQAD